MAFTYGFYNSVNHDRRYDAIQMGQIFDGIIKDGVYETYKKAFIVKESSRDNEVIVQPGRAWFDHTWSYNDSDMAFEALANEAVYDRIDVIAITIDKRTEIRRNYIAWIKGTPAVNPTAPACTHNGTIEQYPIAHVRRRGGQAHIYQRDITNKVGTSECPFVTGVIEGLHINDLIAQWEDEFNHRMHEFEIASENKLNVFDAAADVRLVRFDTQMAAWQNQVFTWLETARGEYDTFLDHNYTAWRNWFDHITTELDGNVAGHLQNQIDKISYMYVIDNVLYLPNTGASKVGNRLVLTNHN